MNKIFTAQQLHDCDAYTIQKEGISSLDLMERAATSCYRWIAENYSKHTPFLIVCAMGNNGGDGLALTRILLQEGYSARAVVLRLSDEFSENTSANFTLLHQLAPDNIKILEEGLFVTDLPESIVIIDALFGIGLNRTLQGWVANFVEELNHLPNIKIAIDMPSGLPADRLPSSIDVVLKATHTLSFQFYKRSFLHPESADYVGKIHLLDIGLNRKFIKAIHSKYQVLTNDIINTIYKPRKRFSHKGNYGKAMLVGGSFGKMGAIALSTKAALRAGVGIAYVQAPECGYDILQSTVPEAMFIASGKNIVEQILPQEGTTIGIGPGLGTDEQTQIALYNFLEKINEPVVLDADALNLVAKDAEMINLLPPNSIFSPHPKEFERLFGATADSMMQVELGSGIAMKLNIVIVLKGHHTAILMPDGSCWYNLNGNPGMATGGSGDVLTGIITGLLAQGYTAQDAALLGVYLHGLSGDIAARNASEEALIASDIIDNLGAAFAEL